MKIVTHPPIHFYTKLRTRSRINHRCIQHKGRMPVHKSKQGDPIYPISVDEDFQSHEYYYYRAWTQHWCWFFFFRNSTTSKMSKLTSYNEIKLNALKATAN